MDHPAKKTGHSRADGPDGPASLRTAPQDRRSERREGATIAIVEDEPDLRAVYEIILRRLGYDVFAATDGEQFLREMVGDGASFDLVLMDYRMPGIDGLEASRKALERVPGLKVIIASADDSIRDVVVASGLGFISKPFSKAELIRAVDGALRVGD